MATIHDSMANELAEIQGQVERLKMRAKAANRIALATALHRIQDAATEARKEVYRAREVSDAQ